MWSEKKQKRIKRVLNGNSCIMFPVFLFGFLVSYRFCRYGFRALVQRIQYNQLRFGAHICLINSNKPLAILFKMCRSTYAHSLNGTNNSKISAENERDNENERKKERERARGSRSLFEIPILSVLPNGLFWGRPFEPIN